MSEFVWIMRRRRRGVTRAAILEGEKGHTRISPGVVVDGAQVYSKPSGPVHILSGKRKVDLSK